MAAGSAVSVREDCLSTRDFARLARLVYEQTGIRLGQEKRTMLEARLRRRLRDLNLDSCSQYCAYLFDPGRPAEEMVRFIDVVTTNKTDFFREPQHFDFLARVALPRRTAVTGNDRPLQIWSAGCSSGEEPYTLAMVLSEYAEAHAGFRFSILATDISTTVLDRAQSAIYTSDTLEPVPAGLRRKYLLRSRDRESDRVRIAPEIRTAISFRRLNLMDADYAIQPPADVIFCRNVMIYFDRPTQEKVLNRLARCLLPDGFLFVGHSESLHDLKVPLQPVAPAVYQRNHA
jgi:chemotaxis protein methyltransferase CheR